MLVMVDRNDFNVAAFDAEASLVNEVLGGVSMLMMTERKNFDEADDVGGADLV